MNGIHVIDKYGAKRYLSYFLIHTAILFSFLIFYFNSGMHTGTTILF